MIAQEFSNQFDVLYSNITSNQAPGLNEYEKSLFLTKAQDELIKNYFNPKGNKYQEGFDDNRKRQIDFSKLIRTYTATDASGMDSGALDFFQRVDYRSALFTFGPDPSDPAPETTTMKIMMIINEVAYLKGEKNAPVGEQGEEYVAGVRQVLPISFDEYTRLMSKPYKNPLKNQAWRLMNNSINDNSIVELIFTNTDRKWKSETGESSPDQRRWFEYVVRFVKRPEPIILADLSDIGDDITIDGKDGSEAFYDDGHCCELDESVHEEILQRAVELAKVAWTATGQDNVQLTMTAGQRSE